MKRRLVLWSVVGVFLASLVSGCCGGGGEKTTVVTQPTKVNPVGEELIKLKEAFDKGAMTQDEYDKAKEKILKGQ